MDQSDVVNRRLALQGGHGVRHRGHPLDTSRDVAIRDAALDLLSEIGYDRLTMDAVAARAHASKATIYRWWPSKELLALDALFSDWAPAAGAGYDTGSLAGDLLALTLPWARQLAAKPYGRVIAALITSAQSDPRFAEVYRARFLQPRRDLARVIFNRAIERGEIPADTDIEVALDLLYGPFYHRVLHGHAQLTDRFTRAIVEHVVTAVARAPGRAR